jgi:hypothetical protein
MLFDLESDAEAFVREHCWGHTYSRSFREGNWQIVPASAEQLALEGDCRETTVQKVKSL